MLFRKKPAIPQDALPRHIGVIMDGNGRWAKKRGLPRSAGHSAGANVFRDICRYANSIGLRYMTFYTFSTENWKRPQEEVDALMNLLRDYLKKADRFRDENMVLKFIGDRSRLPDDLQTLMKENEEASKDATGMVVVLAINYGGQDEILHACRELCREATQGTRTAEELTVQDIAEHLYTAGMPDPDLIIRPSGELRLSNFLTWQSAYAELWFSDVLWPDFTSKHLDAAIDDYARRSRRFGGL